MSIAVHPIGQAPIGADPPPAPKSSTPGNRTVTANADVVQQPEAR